MSIMSLVSGGGATTKKCFVNYRNEIVQIVQESTRNQVLLSYTSYYISIYIVSTGTGTLTASGAFEH